MAMKVKTLKVPIEFDDFIIGLAEETHRQTGLPINKTATMRRMATKLKGRIIIKGLDFDFIHPPIIRLGKLRKL